MIEFSNIGGRRYQPKEIANMPELSAFYWYLKSLPREVWDEVRKTDQFLM